MNPRDQARLRKVCADVLEIELDELESDTDFFEDLNLDRGDLADLIVAVEDAFDIALDAGIGDVRTFEDLETLVEDEIPA